jgi:hypothetical protein
MRRVLHASSAAAGRRQQDAEREAILPQRRDCCRLHAIWARRPAAFHAVAADIASVFRAVAADTASAPACGRRAKPGSHAGLPPGSVCCMRRVPQREDGSRTRSVRLSCLSDATAAVFTRFGPEDPLPLTPSQLRERRKLAEREAILPQRRDCCRLHAIWARRPAASHAVAADRWFSPRPAALSAPRGRGPLRGCGATARVADPSSGPPSRRRWPPHTAPAGPGRRRG